MFTQHQWPRLSLLPVLLTVVVLSLIGRPGVARADRGSPPPGHAVACERHAENTGKSKAHGLECVPAVALPALTAQESSCNPSFAIFQLTGTGFAPDSGVTITGSVSGTIGQTTTDASGTFPFVFLLFRPTQIITATDATGQSATVTVTASCF